MLAAATALLGAPLTPQGGALEALRVLASATPNEQGKASGLLHTLRQLYECGGLRGMLKVAVS